MISVKVPASIAVKVSRLARRRGTTRSEVIRAAIESFDGGSEGSFGELAGDLCGSVAGPGDLSTNKKYFEEFGK